MTEGRKGHEQHLKRLQVKPNPTPESNPALMEKAKAPSSISFLRHGIMYCTALIISFIIMPGPAVVRPIKPPGEMNCLNCGRRKKQEHEEKQAAP